MARRKQGPSTQCVYLSKWIDAESGAFVPPIVTNTAFAYPDVDTWRSVALGQKPGHIYSRNTNPTTELFEKRMALLEGAEAATSFATGMAAISTTLFSLLTPGRRVVSVKDAYGATYLHFTEILPRYNIECSVLDTDDQQGILAAIEKGCDLVYLESPTNPMLKVLDLGLLIGAAHAAGAIVVVDNTFATPINQNPISLGADLVIHSATKFICGHGDALGGIVCGKAELVARIFRHRELTGASLSPQDAYLLLRSLRTLGLRVERHNYNALNIAHFLEQHPKVAQVHYPGLPNDPGHSIAKKQMKGFGGVLSFELEGGFESVKRFLPNLQYAYLAANLGQVETIAGPPATTSHVECTEEERAKAGIPEGLIRYSVGIEDIDDLKADLTEALERL